MNDTLLRLFLTTRNGVPVASLFVFAVGGLMYLAMSRATSSARTSTLAVRRPGWIARRRARSGIHHPSGRVGVGYTSATRSVHLSLRELAGHGATFGGPGRGPEAADLFLAAYEAQVGPVPNLLFWDLHVAAIRRFPTWTIGSPVTAISDAPTSRSTRSSRGVMRSLRRR